MGYIVNGHDPILDLPTVTIRPAKPGNATTDRRAVAVARELERLRKKARQCVSMRNALDRLLRTDPTPEAFKAYKRLDGMEKKIAERVQDLKAAEADLDRTRLLRDTKPRGVVLTPTVVVPPRYPSARVERREWIAGWRQRLKELEKKGKI